MHEGQRGIVTLLTGRGADIFALCEGVPPFTTARLNGHDNICDILTTLMKDAQKRDPKVWVRARIAQLKREIASLEERLR